MAKEKNSFNFMNILIGAGVGYGTGKVIDLANDNVGFLGDKKWAMPLGLAAAAAGVDYFTGAKYPYLVGAVYGACGVKGGQEVENLIMQGYSYVPGNVKEITQQVQGFLSDMEKYKGLENKVMNMPYPGSSSGENSTPANDSYEYECAA